MKKQISLLICALLTCISLSSQNITTCAGTGAVPWNGDNILAVSANVGAPTAVVFDPAGNMYLASSNRIRKITPAGIITTIAGNGTAGFSGDGGQSTLALISDPRGLSMDGAGNLYIADHGNKRVRKITPAGIISTLAGGGLGNDGVAANTASLMSVQDIVSDPAGNVYIAEGSKRKIRKVNTSGIISTYAGTGTSGSTGDGGIAMFCTFVKPIGLALDGTGNLYVADTGAYKVRMITTSSIVSSFAGTGVSGYTGNNLPATTAMMLGPVKLACKGNTVYISDSGNQIVLSVSSGIMSTHTGTLASGFSGDGGLPINALLDTPKGLAVDPYGNLFICDNGNNRVRMVGCNQPVASIVSSTVSLCVGNSATLTANGTTNYNWMPGNITGPVIVVSPSVSTTYSVNSIYYSCSSTSTITQAVTTCTTATVTTGISEHATAGKIKAYPNPFQDKVIVEVDADVKYIEVIDLNGRQVMKVDATGTKDIELNTESIVPGVYFLRVVGYTTGTIKIVK